MGLTLLAILTAAMLLPGIIAARFYYSAGQTKEVDVPVPSLSTPEGISLVGGLSVGVHSTYILILWTLPKITTAGYLPLANPYLVLSDPAPTDGTVIAWSLFTGLLFLSLIAIFFGAIFGKIILKIQGKSRFYGPLTDIITSSVGDDKFITAYIITKVSDGGRLLGYQGTVDSLFRDSDRFPSKVILRDAVPFYLDLIDGGPKRIESSQLIDWLVISADDWHNVAFRVFQVVDES